MDLRTSLLLALLAAASLGLPVSPSAHARSGCPDNLEQMLATPSCDGGAGGAVTGGTTPRPSAPDPGANPAGLAPRATLGNPVSLVTGTKFRQESDFSSEQHRSAQCSGQAPRLATL